MKDLKEHFCKFAEEPFTRQLLLDLFKDYKRPNDKVNELVKQGLLSNVIRGLYVPGPNLKMRGPEKFLVANHLRGPSYISMDAAMSHWSLIPERVYTVTSVTIKGAKNYNTTIGRFTYHQLSLPYYSFGIQRVALTPRQVVLMATPEKAICDKIITTSGISFRSTRQVADFLIEDLRMDEARLAQLDKNIITGWLPDAPKKSSLEILVKTLQRL
ncbi:type IV toxin-antitoxin system AbiEi family antitoxin domain-containing protein [Niabella insulamsoli]|uniref:type IV toxin-antitoxin system AbiEi family antitoxin domain-containing protein n=1 Tax=Niabella insulamsoli TaxID=3144874 RepID=UPI0031FD7FC6